MNNLFISKKEQPSFSTSTYLESLLMYLLLQDLITENTYKNIINDLILLLATSIDKYTGGLNSSVSIDIARNINRSNLYILNYYLKNKSLEESTNLLLTTDIKTIYKYAVTEMEKPLAKTKMFYNVIFLSNLIETSNYFYNSTLKDAIPAFFQNYNYIYDAENIIITADYRPYLVLNNLSGIDFINAYLKYLNYENLFLNHFSSSKIEILLKKLYDNYEELPINIFETVFTVTLLLAYFNKDIFSLNIETIQEPLELLPETITKEDFISKLAMSYKKIKEFLKLEQSITNYLDKCFSNITKKLTKHFETSSLKSLLEQNNTNISYYSAAAMPESDYANLLNEIEQNKDSLVEQIKEKVTSFYDLLKILADLDLEEKDLNKIFATLEIIEIMALKKWYNDYDEDSYILKCLNNYIYTRSLKEQEIVNKSYHQIIIE